MRGDVERDRGTRERGEEVESERQLREGGREGGRHRGESHHETRVCLFLPSVFTPKTHKNAGIFYLG